MYLTENHIESLLSFVGYGDFSKADIVFLANEGGLGNRSVEENILDISERYKANSDHWINGDWRKGYWKLGEWVPGRIEQVPTSPFLRLSSRMVLALENQDQACDLWFKTADNNKLEQVKKFLMEGGLYSKRPGIQTALLDWRPLPRNTEREMLPYENIDQQIYLKAFRFVKSSKDPYLTWTNKRIEIFRNLLKSCPVPIVLCVGNIPAKRILVEHIWGIREFDEIELAPSGKKIFVSKETVGARTKVVLSPFFGYEHMGYDGVCDLTRFIKYKIIQ